MPQDLAEKKRILRDLLEKKVIVYHNGEPCVVISFDDWDDILEALVGAESRIGQCQSLNK